MKIAKKPSVRKDFLIPDALWEEIKPLLPKHVTHHPLGCHRSNCSTRYEEGNGWGEGFFDGIEGGHTLTLSGVDDRTDGSE